MQFTGILFLSVCILGAAILISTSNWLIDIFIMDLASENSR